MGNSRRFRPGRQAARLSQKEALKRVERENAYYRGYAQSLEAQLAASKMERPLDLEDWINEVALPDMSDEEREAWDAMSESEKDEFKDELGAQINATRALTHEG